MKNKDDIARYLRDEMNPDERARFEAAMDGDPLLAEGLEGLRDWQQESHQPYEALESELAKQVDECLPRRRVKKHRTGKTWPLLAAACLLGIIFLGHRLWPKPEPVKLFAQYFRPLTHPDLTLRGSSDSSQALYAVRTYETENYKAAIYHYRKLLEEQPGEEKHRLFLGIAFLANYQPDQAIAILSTPFTVRTEYEDDRQWYLALAYLRTSKYTEAKELLQELAAGTSYYQIMARELSAKLD